MILIMPGYSQKGWKKMNKKEVAEIRKQFTPQRCTVTRIRGCYVDYEKNIKTELKEAFLSLPEEEAFKYFTIFKKTLSGTIGKNLLNMDFPLAEEGEGGCQEFLLRLRDSELKDDGMVSEFYSRIIENYDYPENYYIILIHCAYDVPGRASDGMEMFDASDEVYSYLMCSICPVHLSQPGLHYNTETNAIETIVQDWIVDMPAQGFLFPVFNDRCSDIHSILYYSKNPEQLQENFIAAMFGCSYPLTAKNQRETFQSILSDTLGDECSYETVKTIHETLTEMLEETKDSPDPLVLTRPDVRRLMEVSGVPDEKLAHFDHICSDEEGPEETLVASNLISAKAFQIQTPDVTIKVSPDRADLIETMVVHGRKCLVIPIEDGVEINGIPVHIPGSSPEE